MADIPFQIGGLALRCPQFAYEPGALIYSYQNGSQLIIGAPQVTCTWNFSTDDEAALIWGVYASQVTDGSVYFVAGSPVDVTIPDFINQGLRLTQAYMTRPQGIAVGDGTKNLSVTFYNLHANSMASAITTPLGNYLETINSGVGLVVGSSDYPMGGEWQF